MKHPLPSAAIIGVDTGGTFTDLVLVEGSNVRTWKLPSTPDDPSRAVLEGIRHMIGERGALIIHGSTVATNALLEGKGANVALVVTEGFRDLLSIGRQNRPQLYSLHPARSTPLVPRQHTVEAAERILADGGVEIPLDRDEVSRVVEAVLSLSCKSVALCLLHSYANPVHEEVLAKALEERSLQVSASSRILPEFREYERCSTTVVNAAVSPVMGRYLSRLEQGLGENPLRIMQSNGGAVSAVVAGTDAVRTILSGPAGGMVGAFAAARGAGYDRIITFDMGGTSTDVGLCPGEIPFTSESMVAGWPVKLPMIDIHTVGAGGGSLARMDAGGALRVGPESAGAEPGPACYGRGGKGVTVTDANLYLGRLLPGRFLGGRMFLDIDCCRQAVEGLSASAGLAPEKLAEGVIEVAEETMVGALRVVSISRGHDPRDFVLLPFGGAGGLHACALAEKLGVRRILLPALPGLLSAVGLVLADVIRDYSRSILGAQSMDGEALETHFRAMEEQAAVEMGAEGIEREDIEFGRFLDLRYQGQSFELTIPFKNSFREDFHRQHESLYGIADLKREVEIVTLRLRAKGRGPLQDFRMPSGTRGSRPEPCRVMITLGGTRLECEVYERKELPSGWEIKGPALVTEETATHLLRPGWTGRVDDRGNIRLEQDEGQRGGGA